MPLQTHTRSEIGKTVAGLIALAAFVVLMLTKVPEWIAPQGEQGAPEVGKTVRMVQ